MTDPATGAAQRRDLPAALVHGLPDICTALMDWISTADLPEERVGLHEAAGNIGGLLVAIMLDAQTTYRRAEAGNIFELSAYYKETVKDPYHRRLMEEIHFGAKAARDADADVVICYQALP